ncbi:hypothetical protein FQR65_LT00368 [Abscondita terminalis]|nr:hypothetical protein FQR65_LT00368 [Abscondita terminalis]
MAFVSALLEELKPPNWTNITYLDGNFVKVPLTNNCEEYKQIYSEFNTTCKLEVVSITRIQHPFAFCRFKLRQKQLYHRTGMMPKEIRKFYRLRKDNMVDEILEYNCDQRRDCVFEGHFTNSSGGKYVVVAKTFENYSFNERDSNRFPEYLIECNLNTT